MSTRFTEATARVLLIPIGLVSAAAAVALAVVPVLSFLAGAFALVGFPVTFGLFACLSALFWRASPSPLEAPVWSTFALVPLLTFAEIFLGDKAVFRLLPKPPDLVNVANIDPPSLAGFELTYVAAYVAILTGAFGLRVWIAEG